MKFQAKGGNNSVKEYRIVMLHCAKEDLSDMSDYLAKYYPSTHSSSMTD